MVWFGPPSPALPSTMVASLPSAETFRISTWWMTRVASKTMSPGATNASWLDVMTRLELPARYGPLEIPSSEFVKIQLTPIPACDQSWVAKMPHQCWFGGSGSGVADGAFLPSNRVTPQHALTAGFDQREPINCAAEWPAAQIFARRPPGSGPTWISPPPWNPKDRNMSRKILALLGWSAAAWYWVDDTLSLSAVTRACKP